MIVLAGVVLVFVGISSMFALQQAPFFDADEKAHLGYAHEVADFRLPEIDRRAEIPAAATQWQAELASGRDARYRQVWVANHPPLHYVAVAPLIWFAEATGRADGGLLLMRLANIGFAAVGVVMTYLLATELTRGSRRVGLSAAAIAALVPQGHTYFSRGLNDGLAFAAATGLVWATLRSLRRSGSRRDLTALAVTAAASAGARTATMLLAVVMVCIVVVVRLAPSSLPSRSRVRSAGTTLLVALAPAALLFGPFYLRIARLYGDIGASSFLLQHFGRVRQGSVVEVLTWGHLWVHLYQRMLSTAPLSWAWPRFANVVGAVVILAVVALLVRTRDRVERRAIVVCLVAMGSISLTVAQHIAGGGSPYPRYFFPVLGVVAAVVASALDRLLPRFLPAVLIVAMAWWAIRQMPIGVDASAMLRPRDYGDPPPAPLRELPSGDGWRAVAAVTIVIGALAAAAGAGASAVRHAAQSRRVRTPWRSSFEPEPSSSSG